MCTPRLVGKSILSGLALLFLACAPEPRADPCPVWNESGGACGSVSDCSHAGECLSGVCVCDAPFTGATCAELALGPSRIALAASDASYWDGSIERRSDGRYSLFASRFTNACGLESWTRNSECIRATSDDPLGPYTDIETIVPTLCHNPTVRRAPDGRVLLFSIGEPKDPITEVSTCSGGATIAPVPSALQISTCVINVARSDDAGGTFSERISLSNLVSLPFLCPTNPAPLMNADGSVNWYFRAYTRIDPGTRTAEEGLFASQEASWDSPLSAAPEPMFDIQAEDPFVFRDARRGVYHALFNAKFIDGEAVGGHAVSTDGVHFRTVGTAYTRTIELEDGETLSVARRERPQIYFRDACHGVLVTAVQPRSDTDVSLVVTTPIGPTGETL